MEFKVLAILRCNTQDPGGSAVPPECNQMCNVLDYILCNLPMISSYIVQCHDGHVTVPSEVSTICSSSEATWSFTIAASSDTIRTMPSCSPLTAENC